MNNSPIPIEEVNDYNKCLLCDSTNLSAKDIVYTNGQIFNYFPDLFDLTVDYLCKKINQNPNVHIFFNHQSEAFHQFVIENIDSIVNVVIKKCNTDISQFHLVSGALNCARTVQAYKTLCKTYNYRMTSLWLDNYWETYAAKNTPNFEMDFNRKTKRVLCYNGIPRSHRVASLCEILKRNIFDKCYFSMGIDYNNAVHYNFLAISKLLDRDVTEEYEQVIKNNPQIFPLKLTLEPNIKNAYNINKSDKELFKNTAISLVNETIFSNRDPIEHKLADTLSYPCTFLTEKLNKTFQGLHPFILMSTPHFLSDLRTLGYKTFHPYIDETYDTIEDDGLRFKMVMDEVERFAKMRDSQVFEFQHNTKDILLHNYNLLKTKSRSIVRVL